MTYERFICQEPEGRVSRTVRRLPAYPAVVLEVYDRLHDVPSMFSWEGTPSSDTIEQLLDPRNLFWLVDDVGLLGCIPTEWPGIAHVHCTFWDHRMRGRENMCRAMLVHFLSYGYDEFLTAASKRAGMARAFAQRIGFRVYEVQNDITVLRYPHEMLHGATPLRKVA